MWNQFTDSTESQRLSFISEDGPKIEDDGGLIPQDQMWGYI